ncbi:hypothetical protein, partial [Rosenbergiella collisarenosi]
KGMMFESAESRQSSIITHLQTSGFSESAAIDIAEHFDKLHAVDPITQYERNAMLESALAMEETRSRRARHEQSVMRGQLAEL